MLDVVSAGNLEVQAKTFVFLEEVVESRTAGGLHLHFELTHVLERRKRFIECKARLVTHGAVDIEARFLRQNGKARPTGYRHLTLGRSIGARDDPQ
jgi:hypothetical protein